MKILFAGTPDTSAEVLKTLIAAGYEVGLVLTRQDAPVGRKHEIQQSAVALTAQQASIRVLKANTLGESETLAIQASGCTLGVVVAYGTILSRPILEALPLGWINLHFSLLPKYRGAAPVQNCLAQGDKETGVSIFQLDEGMDSGPIFLNIPTSIEQGENSGDLLSRLTKIGATGLLELLPAIFAGVAKSIPQSFEGASYAPKITRSIARIDWKLPAIEIENRIRAFNPEPMAWTTLNGNAIRLIDAQWTNHVLANADQQTGQIFQVNREVFVVCGDRTTLRLTLIQPAGKNIMNAGDWYRGMGGQVPILE